MFALVESHIPRIEFFKKRELTLEFEIMTLENLIARSGTLAHPLDQPHRVLFHNILFITAGEGKHHIDFQPYILGPGSLVFISRGQVHAFDVTPDIRGYLILFTSDYLVHNLIHSDVISLYRLYNHHLHTPVMQPDETSREAFLPLLEEMMREFGSSNAFAQEDILRLLLKVLLLKMERIKRTVTAQEKNAEWLIRFGRFQEYLEEHITSTRSVKDYAKMLKMTPKHLNTICKAVSGTTAKQYIDNFMILEIKRLLATSNSSGQEISFDLGFEEPTNFVKYFKKHSGQSPSQFRKTFTS